MARQTSAATAAPSTWLDPDDDVRRPAGDAHAWLPGTNQTLCGLALSRARLHRFPTCPSRTSCPSRADPRTRWGTCVRAAWPPPASAPDAGGLASTHDPDARVAAVSAPVPALSALERIAALPGVASAVDEARAACTRLRWHPALRRTADAARAEAGVRAVHSSAALAGARFPLELVRNVARGAETFPDDAAGRTALGVLRAHAEAEALPGAWERSPLQALARLHMVAVAGLVAEDALGRPRLAGEVPGEGADLLTASGTPLPAPDAEQFPGRLTALGDLLAAPASVPALVVAGLVHAEIATLRPFVTGNGIVARALCRAIVVRRGLDPTGVVVWESGLLAAGPPYPLALAGYGQGSPEGVAGWLVLFARAVLDGAAEGGRVADAVLTGRLRSGPFPA